MRKSKFISIVALSLWFFVVGCCFAECANIHTHSSAHNRSEHHHHHSNQDQSSPCEISGVLPSDSIQKITQTSAQTINAKIIPPLFWNQDVQIFSCRSLNNDPRYLHFFSELATLTLTSPNAPPCA